MIHILDLTDVCDNRYTTDYTHRIYPGDTIQLNFPEGDTKTLIADMVHRKESNSCNYCYLGKGTYQDRMCNHLRHSSRRQRMCIILSPHCVFKSPSDAMEDL